MADYRPQNLKIGYFGDGEFKRDHFPGAELAGNNGSQPVLRDFKTATVNPEIPFLPQDLDDQRQLRTVAGVTSCRGLVHASTSCSLLCLMPGIYTGGRPREDRTIVTKTCGLGKRKTSESKVRRAWSFVTNELGVRQPDKKERYTLKEWTRSSIG